MAYTSNFAAVRAQMDRARDAALIAAAHVGINNTKRAFIPEYYTGGLWATGDTINSITRSEPFSAPEGRAIRYGSSLKHNLWWEVGFNQRLRVWFDEKTGRWYSAPGPTQFVRKPIWVPVFFESQGEMIAAYTRTWQRFMTAGNQASEAAD